MDAKFSIHNFRAIHDSSLFTLIPISNLHYGKENCLVHQTDIEADSYQMHHIGQGRTPLSLVK
jgi:hypothetical protein